MPDSTKLCLRCGETKDVEAFPRNKRKSDGYDINCKACTSERQRLHYAKDPAAKITRTRQYHLDHPEWSRERLRAHHVANAAVRAERAADRGLDPVVRAKRRESTMRSEQRRRAIKAASAVVESITAEQLQMRLDEYCGRCWICDSRFSDDVVLHWDHIQPLARGGLHCIGNIAPACDLCNIRKNAVWPFTDARREQIKSEVLALRVLTQRTGVTE